MVAGCQPTGHTTSKAEAISTASAIAGPTTRADAKLVPYRVIREALDYPPDVPGQPADSEKVWAVAMSTRGPNAGWTVVIVRARDDRVVSKTTGSGDDWPPFWNAI